VKRSMAITSHFFLRRLDKRAERQKPQKYANNDE